MKVRFLKSTVAAKQFVKVDQVMDLEEREAQLLIGMGKAAPHKEIEAPAIEAPQEQPKKRRRNKEI